MICPECKKQGEIEQIKMWGVCWPCRKKEYSYLPKNKEVHND